MCWRSAFQYDKPTTLPIPQHHHLPTNERAVFEWTRALCTVCDQLQAICTRPLSHTVSLLRIFVRSATCFPCVRGIFCEFWLITNHARSSSIYRPLPRGSGKLFATILTKLARQLALIPGRNNASCGIRHYLSGAIAVHVWCVCVYVSEWVYVMLVWMSSGRVVWG